MSHWTDPPHGQYRLVSTPTPIGLQQEYFSSEEIVDMSSDDLFTEDDLEEMLDDDVGDPDSDSDSILHIAHESITISDHHEPVTPEHTVELAGKALHDEQIAQDLQRHIFLFFELPGELRNNIYDNCIADVVSPRNTIAGVEITAKKTTIANLLLVSRQFKHEYQARLPHQSEVVITRHYNQNFHDDKDNPEQDFMLSLKDFDVPGVVRTADHVEFVLPMTRSSLGDIFWYWNGFPEFHTQLKSTATVTV